MITEKGIEVHIQPSQTRCYSDLEYAKIGAILNEDLSECQVIAGIKPIKEMMAGKTYMMYSRLASGAKSLEEYARQVHEKKISVIDYERIRDKED